MRRILILATLITTLAAGGCGPGSLENTGPPASGRLVDGLRLIEIDAGEAPLEFQVYRGDYVSFVPRGGASARLVIAELEINIKVPVSGDKPYIKFSRTGSFPFTLGDRSGSIIVQEFERGNYAELDSREAAAFIAETHPFILDVRTKREYDGGHIEGAHLLPVGSLQRDLDQLSPHRDRPIFVYCRSGNRSTVAAKLLLDSGFKSVYNLRSGINGWSKQDLPLVN
jgi:rhodanese-related sulfurtransferase